MKRLLFAIFVGLLSVGGAWAQDCVALARKTRCTSTIGSETYKKFILIEDACELNGGIDTYTVWQCNGTNWVNIPNTGCKGGEWNDVSDWELYGDAIRKYGVLQRCSKAEGSYRYIKSSNMQCQGHSFMYDAGQLGHVACDGMDGIDATNTSSCKCECRDGKWEQCKVESCRPGYNLNKDWTGCVPHYGGVVTDTDGVPLMGVAILAETDRQNAEYYYETDENGAFDIPTDQFDESGVAFFSLVGCEEKVETLTQNMQVVLDCNQNEIDDSVVVADGCTQAKLDAINAVEGKYIAETNTCFATKCKDGAYKVIKKDIDQGWCVYPSYCKGETYLHILDDKVSTDLICLPKIEFDEVQVDEEGIIIEDVDFGELEDEPIPVKYICETKGQLDAMKAKSAHWSKEMKKCIAAECVDGAYKVIDENGVEQGRCEDESYCPDGQKLVVISGGWTRLECINDEEEEEEKPKPKPNDENDPYVLARGKCLEIVNARWNEQKNICECANPMATIDWNKKRCMTAEDRQREEQERRRNAGMVKIKSSVEALDGLVGGFERNVWRDAEGEFNRARLASDMTAGVVLGTAGGLITSHVMKKKQVENGFEDIQCTIGGQTVAGWGDEFQVGIQ